MKKLYITFIAVLAIIQFSYAQWNTPVAGQLTTTNNVGIGTSAAPGDKLEVVGGYLKVGTASFGIMG